jgi:glyoxalase family protein
MPRVHGLHHVTCIAGDPAENLAFYNRVLGMRLVKRTVNQDAPDTYHLFYADAAGSPGTDLTFFPWPHLPPGRNGAGLAVEVALAVPAGSLDFWSRHLRERAVEVRASEQRFGERVLPLADVHGLQLALVEVKDREFVPWAASPVPVDRQIRGLHSVRQVVRALTPTRELLVDLMGLRPVATEGEWQRFASREGGSGTFVDIAERPQAPRGEWGTGAVHHVAWRVEDSAEEMELRETLVPSGHRPTPQIDRFWFKSVYFREPGGTLYELATEGPGFAVDEDPNRLGESLILPPWLEPRRAEIVAQLPPLGESVTSSAQSSR